MIPADELFSLDEEESGPDPLPVVVSEEVLVSNKGVRLDSIPEAIDAIRAGKAIVVIDDEDRENEGDLIFAASKATAELTAFMMTSFC